MRLFLFYSVIHFSYVWLLNYNPHNDYYDSVQPDILIFALIKYSIWLIVLFSALIQFHPIRRTLVFRGIMPESHLLILFLLHIIFTALLFRKEPLAVGLTLADTISFTLSTVLAGYLVRQETDIIRLVLFLQRLAWLVIGIGLYQSFTGYVGPHFGRIISTLGGPENLSMFSIWIIGLFLYRLRFYRRWFDQFISLAGIMLLLYLLLLAQTLTALIAVGVYMLLCALVLKGRALWLYVLSLLIVAGGLWKWQALQTSIQKFQEISTNIQQYSRFTEHQQFLEYIWRKADAFDLLFGITHGVAKFENQYYFLFYNYGFIVFLLFIWLVVNALVATYRAWRQLHASGNVQLASLGFIQLVYFAMIVVASFVTPYLSSFPVNLFAWVSVGITLQLAHLQKRGFIT